MKSFHSNKYCLPDTNAKKVFNFLDGSWVGGKRFSDHAQQNESHHACGPAGLCERSQRHNTKLQTPKIDTKIKVHTQHVIIDCSN